MCIFTRRRIFCDFQRILNFEKERLSKKLPEVKKNQLKLGSYLYGYRNIDCQNKLGKMEGAATCIWKGKIINKAYF